MLDPFEQRRQQVLSQLSSVELDKSRAGGVDARIKGFMAGMNKHADLYTTSSCSGMFNVPQTSKQLTVYPQPTPRLYTVLCQLPATCNLNSKSMDRP